MPGSEPVPPQADARSADDCAVLKFGWVIGPSFQLSDDGKESRYRHRVVQRSVAAEVSLPSWLGSLDIHYETRWLPEGGKPILAHAQSGAEPEDSSLPHAGRKSVPTPVKGTFTIRLPAQPRAALEAIDDRYLREPRVDAYQYLDVVEDKPAAVLITGRNVWRSTEVYLGAQAASQLIVLPDNRGIVARFDKIAAPHGADTRRSVTAASDAADDSVPLLLLTSEGRIQAGQVKVATKDAKDAPAPAVKRPDNSLRIIAGTEYRFALVPALPAVDVGIIRIKSSADRSLALLLEKTTQIAEDGKSGAFVLAADATKLKSGDPVVAELRVSKPNGSVEFVEVLKSGIYYKAEEDSKVKATASRIRMGSAVVANLALPKRAVEAFTALSGGKAQVNASLKVGTAEEMKLTGNCVVQKDSCTVTLNIPDASRHAELLKAKPEDIVLQLAFAADDAPVVAPEKVPVK